MACNKTNNFCIAVPAPQVKLSDRSLQPYNGTVFNLTATVQHDLTLVNADRTIAWIWSKNGRVLETKTTKSPSSHRITITFQPLVSNSSGQYLLNLTVIPKDSSAYIIGNSDSWTSYDLTVESELLVANNIHDLNNYHALMNLKVFHFLRYIFP